MRSYLGVEASPVRMNRPRKKKEQSLMEQLRERNLLGEGDPVEVPDLENEDLIEENSMSVIVRCLNPSAHKVGGLIKALPSIWGMEDRARGRGIGDNRVQFMFESEGDLYHVLFRGPWFVNGWIVSLDQWKPNPGPDFLNRIQFWIKIKGIPIHLLKKQAVESIVEPLGKVEAVELHAKNSSSLEYVRARVWIKTDEPLQFIKTATFKTGEVARIELEYEKLLNVCFLCRRMTHDQAHCPFQLQEQAPSKGSRKLNKSENLKAKGKGKKVSCEKEDAWTESGPHCSKAKPDTSRSVKNRLQWGNKREINKGSQELKVWRAKGPTESRITTEEGSQRECEPVTSQNKRRRLSDSGERQTKKLKTGSSESSNHSPSVFERLGNSGSKSQGKGRGSSNEKSKHSPSVFERLGTQSSESSPRCQGNNSQSDHSAKGAAQGSNQSAASAARNPSLYLQVTDQEVGANLKEGLMDNSNPSNSL